MSPLKGMRNLPLKQMTLNVSRMSSIAKKAQSGETKTAEGGLVDSLVQEVTEEEQTDPVLPDKVVAVLKSIYEGGLGEQAASKRKEKIKRPENCSFLKVTKVNPEIWDIAQRNTRSTDAKLQKIQETLIKSLISLARLAGIIAEATDRNSELPDKTILWDLASNAVLLVAAANHELNMCRRDMFMTDLDEDFKAICSSKQTVGGELFGDDLTELLRVVTKSNKASKRLTGHKKVSL